MKCFFWKVCHIFQIPTSYFLILYYKDCIVNFPCCEGVPRVGKTFLSYSTPPAASRQPFIVATSQILTIKQSEGLSEKRRSPIFYGLLLLSGPTDSIIT